MLFFSLESWGTGFANIQAIQVGYPGRASKCKDQFEAQLPSGELT